MKTLTSPAKRTASDAYLAAYNAAMAALKDVENFIHDNPLQIPKRGLIGATLAT